MTKCWMQRLLPYQDTSSDLLSSFLLPHWTFCLSAFTGSVHPPHLCNYSNKNISLPLSTVSFALCHTVLWPWIQQHHLWWFTDLYLSILSHFNLFVQVSLSYAQPSENFHMTNSPGFTLIRYTWYPSSAALSGNSTCVHVCSKTCMSQWPPLLCSSLLASLYEFVAHKHILS